MLVRELIEMLQELEPDTLVVLQKDPEGNGYSPCAGAALSNYIAESTYSGIVFDDVEELDLVEGEEVPDSDVCVVLWPIN